MSCIPLFLFSRRSSRKSSGGAKVPKTSSDEINKTNAKVWPGDGLSPRSDSSGSSSTRSSSLPARSPSSQPRFLQLEAAQGTGGGPTTTSAVVLPQEDDELVKFGEDGMMQHVQEWVNSLQEEQTIEEEDEEEVLELDESYAKKSSNSSKTSDDAAARAHHNPSVERGDEDEHLSSIVVNSLSPQATSAHLCGLGMQVIPLLAPFSSLRNLSLSSNSIARIPAGCLPKSLYVLDLSRNNISTIEGLRNLTRLRALNLSHNRITRIGHGLASCTSIRELDLAGNKISSVEGLHRLRKLGVLDVSGNRLATSKSLAQLAANYSSLQSLNLLGNPLLLNLGEEQLRRLVAAVVPAVTLLNQQPMLRAPSLLVKPQPCSASIAIAISTGSSASSASSCSNSASPHSIKKHLRRTPAASRAKRVESLQQQASGSRIRRRRRRYA